jgi:bifunctional non-homologous end joining protein LigD
MNAITSTSLYFREGNSDKEYHVSVKPQGEGYIVNFAYGRRGSTLTIGSKTPNIVSLDQANAIHDRLVREKTAKGYRPNGETTPPYHQSGEEGKDSGIRCQLLNSVDENDLPPLLANHTHCLQQKFDGRRLMVRKAGSNVIGINRRGRVVAIPDPIRQAVAELKEDCLIDGEAVGEVLQAFDLLEFEGKDLRPMRYLDRNSALLLLLTGSTPPLRVVCSNFSPADKHEMFHSLRQFGAEGVVFKELEAPFSPGRPNTGGSQVKFKFVESASFVVTKRNERRSVSLGLYDGDRLVPAGNVSIPPNHAVPAPEEVVEVQFLYAFRESGLIYQPVYIGKRCDIPASECCIEQLKYKSEP